MCCWMRFTQNTPSILLILECFVEAHAQTLNPRAPGGTQNTTHTELGKISEHNTEIWLHLVASRRRCICGSILYKYFAHVNSALSNTYPPKSLTVTFIAYGVVSHSRWYVSLKDCNTQVLKCVIRRIAVMNLRNYMIGVIFEWPLLCICTVLVIIRSSSLRLII